MKESPAGENEKLFQETNAKVQVLEKRLETSHKNEEYVRQLYQDATASTSALRAENQTLKEVSEDLKKKASDNLRSIHEINNNNASREYLRQISDLQTRLKDREMELDRAREELRQLKNGRRETRQVSVPRSPRMGMMSPRPGRTAFGASSRAGSPVPAYDNATGVQPGNGRFSHLRD
jgi:fumarate hydratase class II